MTCLFHNAGNGRAPSRSFLTHMRPKSSFSNNDSHSIPRRFVEKAIIGQHFRIPIWLALAFRSESTLFRQT